MTTSQLQQVKRGDVLFWTETGGDGKPKVRQGIVRDINLVPPAVKLEIKVGKDTLRLKWMPAAQMLTASPEGEKPF